jgi:hypothetical protein
MVAFFMGPPATGKPPHWSSADTQAPSEVHLVPVHRSKEPRTPYEIVLPVVFTTAAARCDPEVGTVVALSHM